MVGDLAGFRPPTASTLAVAATLTLWEQSPLSGPGEVGSICGARGKQDGMGFRAATPKAMQKASATRQSAAMSATHSMLDVG